MLIFICSSSTSVIVPTISNDRRCAVVALASLIVTWLSPMIMEDIEFAHRVIHQPVSMVLQCDAGAWLKGLASGKISADVRKAVAH